MNQFLRCILSLIIGLVVDKKEFNIIQKAFHELDSNHNGELNEASFQEKYG